MGRCALIQPERILFPAAGGVVAEPADIAADVLRACGEEPGWLCQRVVEGIGNETLATVTDWLVGRPVKIAFLVVLAWLANALAKRLVQRFTDRLATSAGGRLAARRQPDAALSSLSAEVDLRAEQRFQTVGSVLKNVATVVIWALFLLLVAGEVGLALGPLLAGAGVVGIAIGLGAQGLVRDVVAGLFILVEDQYGVGDVVEAAGRSGVVERVSLRSTRLRDVEGSVWHIPNGEARVVGNKSKGWSRAVVDVAVRYEADLDQATEAIMSVGERLRTGQASGHEILGEPSVWGIEELRDTGVVLRVAVDTRPGSQAAVRRELRRAVKDALEAAGVPLVTPAAEPATLGETSPTPGGPGVPAAVAPAAEAGTPTPSAASTAAATTRASAPADGGPLPTGPAPPPPTPTPVVPSAPGRADGARTKTKEKRQPGS